MQPTLFDLHNSPDHYLHRFDGDDAIFVPMDRAAYHRSIFLDRRISTAGPDELRIPVSMLSGEMQPISWIFHMAHCGSTLLARALDDLDANIVLREPAALRQVGVNPDRRRLAAALTLLGKRYIPTAPTVVKANVPVNFILPEIVKTNAEASAIFLHCQLRHYLLAVLRSDGHRNWVRQVTDQFALYVGDVQGLSDACRAAALWAAQMRAFAAAMEKMPNARSLDTEFFFANPRPALTATAAHLNVAVDTDYIDRAISGPLFSTSAKNPTVAFDNVRRLARRAVLEVTIRAELEEAQRWVETNGLGGQLGRSVI